MVRPRISAKDFRNLLRYGPTWFRTLQLRGIVPPGHVDPGGRRLWFTEAEVVATLQRLNFPVDSAAAATPAKGKQ